MHSKSLLLSIILAQLCYELFALPRKLFDSPSTLSCFCDSSDCQKTNYRCNSPMGACFRIEQRDDWRHGCIEQLSADYKDPCLTVDSNIVIRYSDKYSETVKTPAVLRCCRSKSECNRHMSSAPIEKSVKEPAVAAPESSDRLFPPNLPPSPNPSPPNSNDNRTEWFLILVIVAPLVGLIVLMVLIYFARRLLKTYEPIKKDAYGMINSSVIQGSGLGHTKVLLARLHQQQQLVSSPLFAEHEPSLNANRPFLCNMPVQRV